MTWKDTIAIVVLLVAILVGQTASVARIHGAACRGVLSETGAAMCSPAP
jgi:hypothetical protein